MTETPEIARAYLAAFLPEQRADELAREIVEDAGPDADRSSLAGIAHRRLAAEVRLTDEVAADVLVRELGLTSEEAAGVLGVSTDDVDAAVDAATSFEQDLDNQVEPELEAPPARADVEAATPTGSRTSPVRYVFDAEAPPEEAPPAEAPLTESADGTIDGDPIDHGPVERAGDRRAVTVLVGILVAVAVGMAIAISMNGSTGVTVTDSRTTDQMGDDGPGPAKDRFAPDDAVIFWFSYAPLDGPADVELALLRGGEELISPRFPLPQGRTDSHVTLPRVVTEDPGTYTLELRSDGRVIVRSEFRVAGQ